MVSAISASLSGLNAAYQRVNVSAQNIANAESTQTRRTDGTVTNDPYVPQRLQQISDPVGGVRTEVQPVSPPTVSRLDPNNATANAEGITQYPNVDMANELVQLNIASYDAQANLSVLKVQNRMNTSLLDIIS